MNIDKLTKSLKTMNREVENIINKSFSPEAMRGATPEQMEQIRKVKKDYKNLSKSGLDINNKIFNQFK